MEYTFRTLNATDIAPMCRIITKIGFENVAACLNDGDILKTIRARKGKEGKAGLTDFAAITFAVKVGGIILENIPKCEQDVFSLLASVSGLEYDQIANMELGPFAEMVGAFVRKEEFRDFIGLASKFLK